MKLEKIKEIILCSRNSLTGSGSGRITRMLVLTGFLFVILLPVSALWAETFNVGSLSEFQTALNTAAYNGENDVINVAAGTYNAAEKLTYWSDENHPLTITGAGKGSTILDGGNATQILEPISVGDNGDLTVKDITFRNGNSAYGGALYIETDAATISIDNCEFIDNTSSGVGGGVNAYSITGNISVSNCSFTGNTSGRAGGLFAQTENGISTSLTGCSFEHNACTIDGGGTMLYPLGSGASLTVENNRFDNNRAGNFGGGCWSRMPAGNSTMEYHNNSFSGDSTLTGDAGGTYIEMHSGTLNYTNNTYNNNHSGQDGGGAWIWNETGTLRLSGNTYTGNDAVNNGGGASLITDAGAMTFSNNVLDSNTSGNVGGGLNISTTSGTLHIPNNTFYGNLASEGGGIYFYFDQSSSHADAANNILWHDTPQAIAFSGAQSVSVTYSDIEGGTGESWFGAGCIDTDPLFAGPASGDFHLTWTNFPVQDNTKSPCIDAGDPASPSDPDGTVADMGAFAFSQSTGIQEDHHNNNHSFQLLQNYPNPFNPETTIEYNISRDVNIQLSIFDLNGKIVRTLVDSYMKAGCHKVIWNGLDDDLQKVPSGIYIMRLRSSEYHDSRKIMQIR